MYNECLFQIEEMLIEKPNKSATLEAYGLPVPTKENRLQQISQPKDIQDELNFDQETEQDMMRKNITLMNNEQKTAYHTIMKAIYPTNEQQKKTNNFFFYKLVLELVKQF